MWQAEHCTLHTAMCTLHSTHAPQDAPASAPKYFILHTEHST